MKVSIAVLLAAVVPVLPLLTLQAHHSQITFYFLDQRVEITGVVKELRLVNPHIRMLVEVTEPGGERVTWIIDGPGPGGLIERGWTESTVVPGDLVTVSGCPARNPAARGMYGLVLTKADSTVLEFGGACAG